MTMLSRRPIAFTPLVTSHFLSWVCSFSSRALTICGNENAAAQFSLGNDEGITRANYDSSLHLSPLLSNSGARVKDYKIEVVDNESWRVSTGLAEAWRGSVRVLETKALIAEVSNEVDSYVPPNKEHPDFDEIEDMRIRGNLFYKVDRDSKEFEEYSFDFHRRKSSKGDRAQSKRKEIPGRNSGVENSLKNREERKEKQKKENLIYNSSSRGERHPRIDKNGSLTSPLYEMDSHRVGNKLRTPTFNQLTGPYHEPFCLDIYISKASVRACIIHRATSNVVAVAHSISKDMKFDLGSTRNATACAAVGEVLAQRALADDIHNAVYTPRKGERLEGKLQIVLQSIINNGVNVKVKIKQRKFKKSGIPPTA